MPGDTWRDELRAAIEQSCAALLLLTPNFLGSDFILDEELPALVAAGATLLPVLVDDCLWESVPLLAEVQWLHDPRAGALADASNPTRLIVRACRRLRDLDLPEVSRVASCPQPVVSELPAMPEGTGIGTLDGVPAIPPGYVERAELDGLRAALVSSGSGSVGITGGRALGLHGQGGIGKTVLAAALARDDRLRTHFDDGVHWITLGERADLVAAQIDVLARLGTPVPDLRSAVEGRDRLSTALRGKRCLLIADDVWSPAAAEAFAVAGPSGRVLFTTRDPSTLRGLAADVRPIGALERDAARAMLAELGCTTVEALPADADRILDATGRVPLAVALAGASVGRGGRSWRAAADGLEVAAETFLDHPYANTFKAIALGVGALDDELRAAYESLAVFPGDTSVPIAAVERWWAHRHGHAATSARVLLRRLAGAKLLDLDDRAFTFHDLGREYLLLHAAAPRLMHDDLLRAYRALLPSPGARWSELPRDEPYIWEHLLEHLCAAADTASARAAVTDLAFVAMRCVLAGGHAAETDVRRAAALVPDDEAVARVGRFLSQWSHTLSGHDRAGDVAATLVARAGDVPDGVDADGLEALLPARWPAPRWGALDAPASLLRVLQADGWRLTGVVFSPDGTTLASAGHELRLWDPATGAEKACLRGDGDINSVAFAPDGRTLATADTGGGVYLWDTVSATRKVQLAGHRGSAGHAVFAPDGCTLASGGMDGVVQLWDVTTAARTARLAVPSIEWVRGVAFAPDSSVVATASDDGSVRLWDALTGTETTQLARRNYGVCNAVFAPDGNVLVTTYDDGTVWLCDPETGATCAQLPGHRRAVHGCAFSPDGDTLATSSDDGSVLLSSAADATRLARLDGHDLEVRSVAFAPDGRILATASGDRTVRLWDVAAGTEIARLRGHTDRVNEVTFAPDGRTLASASDDGTVRLWSPATRSGIAGTPSHVAPVRAIVFAPGGRVLATADGNQAVRLWDPASGEQIALLQVPAHAKPGFAFSPDGRTIATASHDHAIRLWEATTGAETARLEGHTHWVGAFSFAPGGRTLATAGGGGTIRLWDPARGIQTGVLRHGARVDEVAFAPDGRTLASAAGDGVIRIWDTASQAQTAVLDGFGGSRCELVFVHDGRTLVTAGSSVRLWDLDSMERTATFAAHDRWIVRLAVSPDGRTLASAATTGTVRLWNLAGAVEEALLLGHAGPVSAVAFAPDGGSLATGGSDGTIRLWSRSGGSSIVTVRLGGGVGAAAFGPDGSLVVGSDLSLACFSIIDRDG